MYSVNSSPLPFPCSLPLHPPLRTLALTPLASVNTPSPPSLLSSLSLSCLHHFPSLNRTALPTHSSFASTTYISPPPPLPVPRHTPLFPLLYPPLSSQYKTIFSPPPPTPPPPVSYSLIFSTFSICRFQRSPDRKCRLPSPPSLIRRFL